MTEVLAGIERAAGAAPPMNLRVAYHDACHLAHAQGVRRAARRCSRRFRASRSCRSRRATSAAAARASSISCSRRWRPQLGRRKAGHIATTSPDVVVTSNPGCILQIRAAASAAVTPIASCTLSSCWISDRGRSRVRRHEIPRRHGLSEIRLVVSTVVSSWLVVRTSGARPS